MTTRSGYAGTTTNLQIVFNNQKNPYLNQATQKNTCQIFLPQKTTESKISNPQKSFDHPRHLKSGVPPPPPPGCNHYLPCPVSCCCLYLFVLLLHDYMYVILIVLVTNGPRSNWLSMLLRSPCHLNMSCHM